MTENKNIEGILVGSIPFTHPAHVPQILVFLRQQALFNTLISSCVRPLARQDPENMTIFEVSVLSWQCILISLEHPFEETLATAELDLSDISALKCKLYGSSINNTEQTSELAGKVLQRCLSIPLTMRTLLKIWEGRVFTLNSANNGNGNFNDNLGSGSHQQNNSHLNGSGVTEFNNDDVKIKQEPGTMNGTEGTQQKNQQQIITQQQQQQQQSFFDAGAESSIGFPSFSGSSDTPLINVNILNNPLQLGTFVETKSKKFRKRKSNADCSSWKSPKGKSDNDTPEIVLESSSSDSTPLGTPTSSRDANSDARTPTPTSSLTATTTGNLDFSELEALELPNAETNITEQDDGGVVALDVTNTTSSTSGEELQRNRERKLKKRAEEKATSAALFEDGKSLVSPSISITPISSSSISSGSSGCTINPNSNYSAMLTNMGLDRRPGIEIIPINSLSQTQLPSSITITAISTSKSNNNNNNNAMGDERKDRKISKSSSGSSRSTGIEDNKLRIEKKRKRKRDSSPMGPPEKLPLKV